MGVMKPWTSRLSAHVDLGGSAVLFRRDGERVGKYLVQDLTSRGALLTGDHEVTQGGRVHVLLALPSRVEPLRLWGPIDRSREGDTRRGDHALGLVGVEVRFAGLSADEEDAIEDAILAEWSRLRDERPKAH